MADYSRPLPGEFAPYYARYIDQVPGQDVLVRLADGCREAIALLDGLSEEQSILRYAPDKWSVKELVGHLIDTERLFAFRALWFARGDQQAQPGMDENAWARMSNAHQRPLADLGREYETVRAATLCLLDSLDETGRTRSGSANGQIMTVRAIPWVVAGHELHHLNVLRERYLV